MAKGIKLNFMFCWPCISI